MQKQTGKNSLSGLLSFRHCFLIAGHHDAQGPVAISDLRHLDLSAGLPSSVQATGLFKLKPYPVGLIQIEIRIAEILLQKLPWPPG